MPCHPAFAIALSAQNAVLDTSSVSVHTETDRAFCRLPGGSVMNGSSTARAASLPIPVEGTGASWSCTLLATKRITEAMAHRRRSCASAQARSIRV